MKSELFYPHLTQDGADTYLQHKIDSGAFDTHEADLLRQFFLDRTATQPSFSWSRQVRYINVLSHVRETEYLKVPWYDASLDQILQMVALYKSSPIRFKNDSGIHEKQRHYSSNTLQQDIRQIVTWLKWLSDKGIISVSLKEIEKIRIPKYEPKRIPKESIYTEQMIAKLVEVADPMMAAMIWTHYETGCRSNEICDLEWSDIEWRDKSALIRIRDSKEKQVRSAFVSNHSIRHLLTWRNMYPGDPVGNAPVFVTKKNTKLTYHLYRMWLNKLQFTKCDGKRIRRMPPFTPHDLRRWRATNLFRQGVNRSTICLQLWGNTKTDCDSVYSQFSYDDAYAEMERVYGIKEVDETQKPLAPNYCPHCGSLNPPGKRYCGECGQSLSADAAETVNAVKQDIRLSSEYMIMMQEYIRSEIEKALKK